MNENFNQHKKQEHQSSVESESGYKIEERHILQINFADKENQDENIKRFINHLQGTLDMRAIEFYENDGVLPEDGSSRLCKVEITHKKVGDNVVFNVDLRVTSEGLANYECNKAAKIDSMNEFLKDFPDLAGMDGMEFKEFSELVPTTAQGSYLNLKLEKHYRAK